MYGEKSELNKLMRVNLSYILSLVVGICNGYYSVPSYILYVSGYVCGSCTIVYWRWINTPSPEMYDVNTMGGELSEGKKRRYRKVRNNG